MTHWPGHVVKCDVSAFCRPGCSSKKAAVLRASCRINYRQMHTPLLACESDLRILSQGLSKKLWAGP